MLGFVGFTLLIFFLPGAYVLLVILLVVLIVVLLVIERKDFSSNSLGINEINY